MPPNGGLWEKLKKRTIGNRRYGGGDTIPQSTALTGLRQSKVDFAFGHRVDGRYVHAHLAPKKHYQRFFPCGTGSGSSSLYTREPWGGRTMFAPTVACLFIIIVPQRKA